MLSRSIIVVCALSTALAPHAATLPGLPVSVILERLGVTDRTQAVIAAVKRGLEHL